MIDDQEPPQFSIQEQLEMKTAADAIYMSWVRKLQALDDHLEQVREMNIYFLAAQMFVEFVHLCGDAAGGKRQTLFEIGNNDPGECN